MTIPFFPTLPGAGFPSRSPVWKTSVQEAVSGKDYGVSFWAYPRYRWQLPLNLLREAYGQTEWIQMVALINECSGRGTPFHFQDSDDCSVTAQSLGVGDGTTTVFLFVRMLGSFVEPIQDVTPASVHVSVNGAVQAANAYVLKTDPNFGLTYAVQFNTAPLAGAAITANFTFNWACRFDDDEQLFQKTMSGRWKHQKIAFTSIKVL